MNVDEALIAGGAITAVAASAALTAAIWAATYYGIGEPDQDLWTSQTVPTADTITRHRITWTAELIALVLQAITLVLAVLAAHMPERHQPRHTQEQP